MIKASYPMTIAKGEHILSILSYRGRRRQSEKETLMQTRPITAVVSALLSTMKLATLIVCATTLVFSQTQNKTVEWSSQHIGSNNERAAQGLQILQRIEGIEIEGIAVGDKSITIGQPFSADDDWLKSLEVRVKNISGRQVTLIQITLTLPELERTSPYVVFCYGCALAEKEKGVKPDETVALRMLGGSFYDWVKDRAAEKGGISRISKAEIDHMIVHLLDGTHWMSGCIKTADPKNACQDHDSP
jgi:hypothetical protein